MDISLKTGDITLANNDIVLDNGLETAVLISLFTDAPDGKRGGYWGDTLDARPMGSLLWTYKRGKITDATLPDIKATCAQALQWMIDDGVAESVTVSVTRTGLYSVQIVVNIARPGTKIPAEYTYLWEGQLTN